MVNGTAPPDSQVPKIADGTLVRPSQVVFPTMKGLTWPVAGTPTAIPEFQYLARYNGFSLLDFGPQYLPQDESGIATQLPPYYTGQGLRDPRAAGEPEHGLALSGIQQRRGARAAGHQHRVQPDGQSALQREREPGGRLHPVPQDRGGAHRGGRHPAVARIAVRQPGGLRRCGHGRGRPARRPALPAAPRCGPA